MIILLLIVVLGLCFGSFVNAFVYRLYERDKYSYGLGKEPKKPTKKSFVNLSIWNGRSICVDCKHVLAWHDLLPVFSWLSLGGKCRYCKKPISWQYPSVEITTAVLFILSYVFWPASLVGLANWLIFGFWLVYLVGFMALIVFDVRWMLLPNKVVYGLSGVFLLQIVMMISLGILSSQQAINMAIGALVLSSIFLALFQMSDGRWIGGGDVKLAVLLGALAGGAIEALLVLFIASFAGSLIGGLVLFHAKKFKLNTQLPFGPYLMLATIIVVLFGGGLIDWYRGLISFT